MGLTTHNWFLIHTKIRQEQVAQENLERQGFSCFLPKLWVEKVRRGKLVTVEEPLFPRYLFIRLDTSLSGQNWGPIRSTTGVSRLVTFGNVPAKIDDELIDVIRVQSGTGQVQQRQFEAGDQVVITQGPFAGIEAVFQIKDGESRVMVLIEILSKPTRLALPPTAIRKND